MSVVCPFFNERPIIEGSVRLMLASLQTLPCEWELIIVSDGSRDGSYEAALALARESDRLRVLGYPTNRGRGYALRTGIASAGGDIIVTTEIDSSWGDDIVHRIWAAFNEWPDADIIIASPHLPGGGYKNVPLKRVLLSALGNYVIRSGLTYGITMNTGMTRGYRREKFLALPLDEDEKEMHLEVVNKALAFGYRIREIPAVLEWRAHKLAPPAGRPQGAPKRRSSANINKLIRTHVLFSLLAAPFRYLFLVSAAMALVACALEVGAAINLFRPEPSVYLFLSGLLLLLFAFVTFGIAVLAQQGRAIQRDLWRVRSELRQQALRGGEADRAMASAEVATAPVGADR